MGPKALCYRPVRPSVRACLLAYTCLLGQRQSPTGLRSTSSFSVLFLIYREIGHLHHEAEKTEHLSFMKEYLFDSVIVFLTPICLVAGGQYVLRNISKSAPTNFSKFSGILGGPPTTANPSKSRDLTKAF